MVSVAVGVCVQGLLPCLEEGAHFRTLNERSSVLGRIFSDAFATASQGECERVWLERRLRRRLRGQVSVSLRWLLLRRRVCVCVERALRRRSFAAALLWLRLPSSYV